MAPGEIHQDLHPLNAVAVGAGPSDTVLHTNGDTLQINTYLTLCTSLGGTQWHSLYWSRFEYCQYYLVYVGLVRSKDVSGYW